MNALMIANVLLSPRIGGAEALVSALEAEWSQNGVSSTTVYLDPSGEKLSRAERLRSLRSSLSRIKPSVVLAHSYLPALYARMAWGFHGNVHPVLHSGGDDYSALGVRTLERALKPLSASVIAVGDQPAKRYLSHFPSAANLIVIPNGVSTAFKPKTSVAQSPRRVVTVARVDMVKRPDLWEEVTSRCAERHPDLSFEWWGPLSGQPELDRFVLNPRSPVASYMGPSGHVNEVLTRADFLLHTSDYESSGIALLEAAATGIPVVYANSIAQPADGQVWDRTFDAGSPADCLRAIDSLVADWPDFSSTTLDYAKQRRDDLTIEQTARAYLEWLADCHPGVIPAPGR